MDLEQRVKVLEQEILLLKGQIQATLLDIQAQLLTTAQPSLQAETNAKPNPTFTESPTEPARPNPLHRFKLMDDGGTAYWAEAAEGQAPVAAAEAAPEPPTRRVCPEPPQPPQPASTMANQRLVNEAAEPPSLATQPRIRRPALPATPPIAAPPPPPASPFYAVPFSPMPDVLDDDEVEPALPLGFDEDQPDPAPDDHHEDPHRNTILKLIAGVQSAGIGRMRRKNRG